MQVHKAECPNCGATLEVNLDKERAECTYCGKEFLLNSNQPSISISHNVNSNINVIQSTTVADNSATIILQRPKSYAGQVFVYYVTVDGLKYKLGDGESVTVACAMKRVRIRIRVWFAFTRIISLDLKTDVTMQIKQNLFGKIIVKSNYPYTVEK